MYMQDYYSIPADQFSQLRNYDFNFVGSHLELCEVFAREIVDLIKENASDGKMTKVILPVGPLMYGQFADLCNKEGVSCESLVIFAMDEYLDDRDKPLSTDNPLSFRAYFQRTFVDRLDEDKKIRKCERSLDEDKTISGINVQRIGRLNRDGSGAYSNGR